MPRYIYYEEIRYIGWPKVLKILGFTPKTGNRNRYTHWNKMNCCFHKERNNSLFIFYDSSSFTCFGCWESGDIFEFVMKFRKYSRIQTMVFFKKHFGIDPKNFLPNGKIRK